ncbi:hypothetical protein HGRIS_008213 [Hohenbuehelia grisea]|uniref:F-box domain-containing protein n=1 Tax=Hohenbuehelia grisea TaxID=104357 RepID=A0ABR3J7A9_9AGAR
MQTRLRLDVLPYDILHEILQHFGSQEKVPRQFRVINALARVNRRLRSFALPIVLSEISTSSPGRLRRALDFFSNAPPDYALFVRTLLVAAKTEEMDSLRLELSKPSLSQFKSLRKFYCLGCTCNPNILRLLEAAPHLHTVVLVWNQAHAADLSNLHSLKSVRFIAFPSFPPRRDRRRQNFNKMFATLSSSLTSLSIHSARKPWVKSLLKTQFPCLEVFNLTVDNGLRHDTSVVSDFIIRHPLLREVNLAGLDFSFGAVVRLISANCGDHNLPLAATSVLDIDAIRCTCFGYTRVSMQPQSPDADRAWYIKSLALDLHPQSDLFEEEIWKFSQIPLFPALSQVEDLTLRLPDYQGTHDCMRDFMRQLRQHLQEFAYLRNFTLGFEVPGDWLTWGSHSGPFPEHLPPGAGQDFIWDILPPVTFGTGKSLTIAETRAMLECYTTDVIAETVDVLKRDIDFCMGPEFLAEHGEDAPLLSVWEMLHERKLEEAVRSIAEVCPRLEAFDWYMAVTASSDAFGDLLWRWRVCRSADSGIRMLNGRLLWKNGPGGDPPPLRAIAGEEQQTTDTFERYLDM